MGFLLSFNFGYLFWLPEYKEEKAPIYRIRTNATKLPKGSK